MAQGAGIQLQVGLDLAYFRNQLPSLGATAAGYKLPINITFDRRSIQNELNALGRNISQRKYRLEVATNISAEIKNAGTLAKALRGLDNAIQKNRGIANRTASGVTGGTVDASKIQALVNKATKPALQALYSEMSKASIPMAAVGKDTVANLRSSILSGVPQLTTDLARGISSGLNPKMKENGTSSAKLFVDAFKSATGIASPSKVFKALGEFSADGLEIGFLNGLKDFKTKAIGEIKQIAALMKLELASVGDVRIGPGTGAARAGTRGGRQYMSPIGPLPTGSREPWAFSQYQYQPFMAQPGQARGAGVAPMRTRQPFLPVPPVMGTTSSPGMLGQARLALPAAGETSARAMREAALALREFTARQRSDARSASVMGENRMWSRVAGQVPVGAGGPFLPPGAGGGVPPRPPSGGGGGGMGGFGRALGGINLPGTGVVREIGNEFAMATKQVLLFGTAYKALAFATSFPAQVGQAVGALQSFRNTLKTIAPTAAEVKTSNDFILDTVDRYNVPLESARTGFTRLYASMAPAGFKGDEIRELFLGISKTSATLGLGADQVDRVTYAFGQMASKGQFMAEEVTGQLGDVIPGALSIMAEAAGMGIKEFKKAMEDGAFTGTEFTRVMNNVPKVLEKEFGKGAEGAAKTFQGLINRMQNSTRVLYEAFEPVAVGFLNSVVVPLTSGIKTITDGFNAFFTSTQAKTAGGSVFAQELEKLKPAFEGIRTNIAALIPALQGFGGVLLEVSKVFLQIAANPFVGYLTRVYLSVLPLVTIIKVLNLQALIPMIGSLLRAVPAFLTFNSLMVQGNRAGLALKTTTFLLGSTSAVTAGQIRLVGTALLSLGMPAVLLGIGALIERFMMLKGAVDGVRQSTQQMVGSISSLANTGAVKEIRNIGADTQKQISTFKGLQPFVGGGLGNAPQQRLTENAAKKMEELGLGSFVSRGVTGPYVNDFLKASKIIEERLKGLGKTADSVREKMPLAEKAAAGLAKQARQGIEPMPAGAAGGAGGAAKPKEQSLESYHSLQDQLAKNFTQDQLDRIEKEYQARVDRINAEFNLREARANSLQKEAIRFERQMSDIELKRQKALLDASAEVIRAQGSVAGGASGQSTTGATGLLQGSTGISSGAHFDVRRQDGGYISPDQARALFDPSVRRQLAMTSAYGPRRAPVPGASTFHRGVDLAGPANTPLNLAPGFTMVGAGEKGGLGYAASVRGPAGEMYDVGHLQRPKAGAGAPRKVPGSEKRDIVAEQRTQLAVAQQSVAVQTAEAQAIRDAAVAWAEYTAAIAPIEEQKLQNSILTKKNELVRLGMPDDVIEKEMKHFETQQKTALAVEVVEKMLAEKKISLGEAAAKTAELNKRMADYNKLLGNNIELQRQQKFDANLKQLKDQIEALRIIDDEERRLFELRKEYGDDKKAQEIFNLEKIKKNIEDTRSLIDGFVSQTSSDYKGFLKAVISGEDAVDALKQFQEGLKDRVLTIFLDFAMAPVEKMMKQALEGIFIPKDAQGPKPEEEKAKTGIEGNTSATNENTAAIKELTAAFNGEGAASATSATSGGGTGGGMLDAANVFGGGGNLSGGIFDTIAQQMGGATESFDSFSAHMGKFVDSSVASADAVGSWGDSFNTQLSESLTKATETTNTQGATFQEGLGKVVGGIGVAAGAIMGIAAGIGQIKKGGTANVLGGIGSILTGVGGGMMGFMNMGLFGANGGVAPRGWKPFPTAAFANGGMVTGPTLGLVGEGKYNEAIVPLPDGRSIPVQMRGGSSRELLNAPGSSSAAPTMLSMSFQSTTINGVEYVDRAQLEAAMAETRKSAARDGASRGASLALDKLQNSPSTRRRVGIR